MRYIYLLLALCLTLQNCMQPGQPEAENTATGYYTIHDFDSVEKIDAHVHINTGAPYFVQQAATDHFKLITINLDDVNEPPPMEEQQQFALQQLKAAPGRVAYATSFSIRHFNDTGWLQQNIHYIQNSFVQGAVAVKIYKVIGMALRDKKGKLVMIDDARFEFPNMAVDMAARIGHLQYQASKNWQKVHDFMMKYQDRLIYATDLVTDTTANEAELKAHVHTTWLNDWTFFATDSTMSVNDFDGSFKCLHLPRPVMDKIYRKNAEKWFPGAYGKHF